MSQDAEEAAQRRAAEVDFIEAAYEPEEAWCVDATRIFRRLGLPLGDTRAEVMLELYMPPLYPVEQSLEVSGSIVSTTNPAVAKAAYNALPDLLNGCTQLAQALQGSEAVLSILQHAEEWVNDQWPEFTEAFSSKSEEERDLQRPNQAVLVPNSVLGRRLIYSHHIISKHKRADLQDLAVEYHLTGFVKIGWPGLIIVEGLEEDCQAFYDKIRRWRWQHLVIRGEMQEEMEPESTVDECRRFPQGFVEEEDMSVVAEACRKADLEALFKTSMKLYDHSSLEEGSEDSDRQAYGCLVQVDHMNDGKSYRKWLRRTANDCDLLLMIKECYGNNDYSTHAKIFVGLVGSASDVKKFLKRWRTVKVDVDSRGKPCLERMMSVLSEGRLERISSKVDSEETQAETEVVQPVSNVLEVCRLIGGRIWEGAILDALTMTKSV